MKTGVKVSDAMTMEPICIGPDDNLYEAVKLMKTNKVNSLIVKEGDRLLGLVTDGDFVRHIILSKLDPERVAIKTIMSTNLTTIEPNQDIYEAMRIMANSNIRHLPVAVNDKLKGLLTVKDILKINPALLEIFIEKVKIRESERKLGAINSTNGICEICGKTAVLSEIGGGMLVCSICRERSK